VMSISADAGRCAHAPRARYRKEVIAHHLEERLAGDVGAGTEHVVECPVGQLDPAGLVKQQDPVGDASSAVSNFAFSSRAT